MCSGISNRMGSSTPLAIATEMAPPARTSAATTTSAPSGPPTRLTADATRPSFRPLWPPSCLPFLAYFVWSTNIFLSASYQGKQSLICCCWNISGPTPPHLSSIFEHPSSSVVISCIKIKLLQAVQRKPVPAGPLLLRDYGLDVPSKLAISQWDK